MQPEHEPQSANGWFSLEGAIATSAAAFCVLALSVAADAIRECGSGFLLIALVLSTMAFFLWCGGHLLY
jgi:hypothetical protein